MEEVRLLSWRRCLFGWRGVFSGSEEVFIGMEEMRLLAWRRCLLAWRQVCLLA